VVDELAVIPGNVPNLIDLPKACRFAPRCTTRVEEDVPYSLDVHPELRPSAPGHKVRCWLYHDLEGNAIPRPAAGPAGPG
jgi:peptide/nickel transport system ATP-binding protein